MILARENVHTWWLNKFSVFRFVVDIHDEECGKFLGELNEDCFISLLVDGATDSGNLEKEIYVKFYKKGFGPIQKFLGIQDVKYANAAGVLQAIDTGIHIFLFAMIY